MGDRAFGGWASVSARMAHLQPRVIRQRHVPRMATGLAGATYRARARRVPRRPRPPLPGGRPTCPAPTSSWTRASRPPSSSHCAGSTASTCGSSTWSGTHAASPARGASRASTSRTPRAGTRWAPTRHVGWPCSGPHSSSSAPSWVRPRPTAARVRYEDLVAAPRPTLETALTSVGLAPREGSLAHVGDRSVVLAASHGVAGSRTRFTVGRIELQLDDAWRSTLPSGARRVVTAVTLPQLLGYGYVGRRPRAGLAGRA